MRKKSSSGCYKGQHYRRASWQRLRQLVLSRDVLCCWPGCIKLATDVDHIIPLRAGGDDEMCNLQGLCARHHGLKGLQEQRDYPKMKGHIG